jgi:glycosyltransferase involved in cell wall biosynthesis
MPVHSVDVIFPCLNEASALPSVLEGLPRGYHAIVVDNGSTDGSARVALDFGATVIHESRRGFGAAAHAGLEAATAETVAFCDADGSFDSRQLPMVVDPVLAGDGDLVLGRRIAARGAWPLQSRLANLALSARLRSLTGVQVHDLGPMRAARRVGLLGLGLTDRRSGYPLEMFFAAHAAHWRIREVGVSYLPRIGRSKVTGTLGGYLGAVSDMSRVMRTVQR